MTLNRSSTWLQVIDSMVGAGRFERPTPCAQGRMQNLPMQSLQINNLRPIIPQNSPKDRGTAVPLNPPPFRSVVRGGTMAHKPMPYTEKKEREKLVAAMQVYRVFLYLSVVTFTLVLVLSQSSLVFGLIPDGPQSFVFVGQIFILVGLI